MYDWKSFILNNPFLVANDNDAVRACLIYVMCQRFWGKEANDRFHGVVPCGSSPLMIFRRLGRKSITIYHYPSLDDFSNTRLLFRRLAISTSKREIQIGLETINVCETHGYELGSEPELESRIWSWSISEKKLKVKRHDGKKPKVKSLKILHEMKYLRCCGFGLDVTILLLDTDGDLDDEMELLIIPMEDE
uniref:Uncharacterized protein n=1 Tax=Lactuca sativa TaxID=4236 RepID=A0A9R1WSY8_LACSA|nr:hypothetical protein LSAT_V11C900457300 [Lactuca sativa]